MRFWAAQDVAQTVLLLAEDADSAVYLDASAVSMSGDIKGRDVIAQGLYGNLATWHYLSFDWDIASVEADTGRVQVRFEYQHQTTALRYAGTMRMVVVVTDGFISRVECHHDGPRVAAFMQLVAEAEARQVQGP